MTDLDLDAIEATARAASGFSTLVAPCSPDVVLALVAEVRTHRAARESLLGCARELAGLPPSDFDPEAVERVLGSCDDWSVVRAETVRRWMGEIASLRADAKLGARLRSILVATGHDADSLAAAEEEPHRAGLADFTLRLVVALREEAPDAE